MAKPYGPIIHEDTHNAFYEAYTKTIQAGPVPPLTETEDWLGPFVVDPDFRFLGDVEDR